MFNPYDYLRRDGYELRRKMGEDPVDFERRKSDWRVDRRDSFHFKKPHRAYSVPSTPEGSIGASKVRSRSGSEPKPSGSEYGKGTKLPDYSRWLASRARKIPEPTKFKAMEEVYKRMMESRRLREEYARIEAEKRREAEELEQKRQQEEGLECLLVPVLRR